MPKQNLASDKTLSIYVTVRTCMDIHQMFLWYACSQKCLQGHIPEMYTYTFLVHAVGPLMYSGSNIFFDSLILEKLSVRTA